MAIKFSIDYERNNFVKLLKKYNYKFSTGNIFAGEIIGLEKSLSLVDIGSNIVGSLPISEISDFQSFNINEIISIKQVSEFLLIQYNLEKNYAITSLKKFKSVFNWQRLKILNKENLIISGQLEKSTKKGKIVRVEGLKGFIINSNLPKFYRRKKLQKLILPLKFIKLNENKNKLFFSSKLAYFKNQIKYLKLHQSISGCITQVRSYGLFVNLFGLKGLLHISQISSQRISDLTKLFKKGDAIIIVIIYINLNRGRISLSLQK